MKRKALKLFAALIFAAPMLYGSSFAGTCGITPCIDSADIINGQVGAADLATSAVTSPKLATGSVGTGKIMDSAVTGAKVLDGSLTGADIQDGSIGPSDLNFTPGDVTGVSAGTGLTGGGVSGDVALEVIFGGTGVSTSAARSDHNHNSVYLRRYGKTAVVALSNGQYTSPRAAMNNIASWCGMPSAVNPCMVKIMPGIYNLGATSLDMQPFVDIEGSGENTTIIKGAIKTNGVTLSGVVNGASNSELRFLTVLNATDSSSSGESDITIAIVNKGAKLTNLTVLASGIASVSAAADVYAIFNDIGDSTFTNVTATATGGSHTTCIYTAPGTNTRMNNVYAVATGASQNDAVWLDSSADIANSTMVAHTGSTNYGVVTGAQAVDARINNSVIAGSLTNSILSYSTAYVAATRLDASVTGTATCAGVYNQNYQFYPSTCP